MGGVEGYSDFRRNAFDSSRTSGGKFSLLRTRYNTFIDENYSTVHASDSA